MTAAAAADKRTASSLLNSNWHPWSTPSGFRKGNVISMSIAESPPPLEGRPGFRKAIPQSKLMAHARQIICSRVTGCLCCAIYEKYLTNAAFSSFVNACGRPSLLSRLTLHFTRTINVVRGPLCRRVWLQGHSHHSD